MSGCTCADRKAGLPAQCYRGTLPPPKVGGSWEALKTQMEVDVTRKAALPMKGTVPAGLPLGLEGDRVQESHTGALSCMWLSAGLSPLACVSGG